MLHFVVDLGLDRIFAYRVGEPSSCSGATVCVQSERGTTGERTKTFSLSPNVKDGILSERIGFDGFRV